MNEERRYPSGEHPLPSFEEEALSRSEYITSLVHFYRGNLDRATQWRLRLDNTTNWAIISVLGLVTFSFRETENSHVAMVAGMVLVFTYLHIEARRFRFFDLWRGRVHMLEENFFGPILRRDLHSPVSNWGRLVAEDLLHPRFKITYHQSLRARFLRNYFVLFILLFLAWAVEVFHAWHLMPKGSPLLEAVAVGPIPWWVSLVAVAGLYSYLVLVVLLVPNIGSPEEEFWGEGKTNDRVPRVDI